MTRYQVRRAVGASLILRINPRSVSRHAGTNQPRTSGARLKIIALENRFPQTEKLGRFLQKCLYSAEPFMLSDRDFSDSINIEDEARYRLIEDFIANRDNPKKTEWYRKLMLQLSAGGVAVHKDIRLGSEDEIMIFLRDYAGDLIESLEASGYDERRTTDVGTAFIDAEGRIQKCDAGNHRFSAARILGVTPVPVEILGIHHSWYGARGGRGGYEALRNELRKIEAAHMTPACEDLLAHQACAEQSA